MHAYERWIVRRYVVNVLKTGRFARAPRPGSDLVAWLDEHAYSVGLAPRASTRRSRRSAWNDEPLYVEDWASWRRQAFALANDLAPRRSPLQKRIDWLSRACGLTGEESEVLGLAARLTLSPKVTSLVEAVNSRHRLDLCVVDGFDLRPLLGSNEALQACSNDRRLAELGLVDARTASRLSNVARRILALPRLGARNVVDLLLGQPEAATLKWVDFEHLGELRDLTARIVAASRKSRDGIQCGPNLLFYGPPGTGKTEFAKTLGAQIGFSVRFIGEANDDNAQSRNERIAALMIANAVGAVARRTILVVDEADDLFLGVDERRGREAFMDRLVERMAAPTIWIANDADRLGPAIIRRMNLALRFPRLRFSLRKAMVARIAKGHGMRLDDASAETLARARAAPTLVENAIRSATQFGASARDAAIILSAGLRALGRAEPLHAPTPIPFDPALSSADVDLAALAERIAQSKSQALSFLFSGPPGTGKSAYARHLAERLDLDVLDKRYSDLSSMWVGESEKAIALAFEEAADLRAFLVFDEADSLLRDRSVASFSWEVTQVNEMLTQMERHAFPFACTTNAPDLLDSATARRFLFKARFLPMTPSQIQIAYRRAFRNSPPSALLELNGVTPGDFAIVALKAAALSETDPRRLAKWLEEEVDSKPNSRRRIGF
jgi:transitional endoplasmic reticulum ATPase